MSYGNWMTIAEAARRQRDGEITATEIVQGYLDRIATTQSRLHAFISVDAERALDEAREADVSAAAGHWRGPLHGIPLALKDVIASSNTYTTCHSRLLLDNFTSYDAVCVSKLRAAGAIILGKVATHEFAFGGPSHDLPFPAARNPWNPDRIPGGSSSGSAVAVAAGLSAGALGTDTSGSIRMPASMCGVVGIKPTYGRVSRDGVYPLSYSMDHVGPLTQTVADGAMLLAAMSGAQLSDQPDPLGLGEVAEAGLRGVRVGICREWFEGDLDPDAARVFDRTLDLLRDAGATVANVSLPPIADLNACGRIILLSEGFSIHRATLSARPEDYGQFTRDRMRLGAFISADHYIRAQRMRRDLMARMDHIMESFDILISPTVHGGADRFSDSTETYPFFARPYLTMPFDVTGQPAMSIPHGVTGDGMPLGLQLAARTGRDAGMLRIAHRMEKLLALPRRLP